LNFGLVSADANGWEIQLPTSRLDVTREIDLIEEIARHYGYGRFPSTLPNWRGGSIRRPELSRQRKIKRSLMSLGYTEVLTYPFINAAENSAFSAREPVRILNPISQETLVAMPRKNLLMEELSVSASLI
jgi:phenylalanyl-tRNA synthetase beta chain